MSWNDGCSVNNETLDNHHKELFNIFRRLNDKCRADDSAETYAVIIEELDEYSSYHFSTEEQCMRDAGYQDIHSHMLLHKFFRTRLVEVKLKIYKKEYKLCHELILFLGNWLKQHVMVEDKKMSLLLNRQRISGEL
jgi:hemerythrin-like metal-binding protein